MKIVTAVFKYDYGKIERGESGLRIVIAAFERLGHHVTPFWLEENGYPDDIPGLQTRLLRFVESDNPDMVFFMLMENEIARETLDELSARCKTVNWFCDDQWRFFDYTQVMAPHLSYCVTVDKYSVAEYRKIGYPNVIHSQWPAVYREGLDLVPGGYEFDVTFVGGRDIIREYVVAYLREAGIEVACFGAEWENGRVSGERMQEIFLKSKINLNISNSVPNDRLYGRYLRLSLWSALFSVRRIHGYRTRIRRVLRKLRDLKNGPKSVEQIKARNFEIPAAGGFQISQFALEIEDYFTPGREIVLYSRLDELVRQIRYYLENDEERESIRRQGYLRAREYTWENRLRDVLQAMDAGQRVT